MRIGSKHTAHDDVALEQLAFGHRRKIASMSVRPPDMSLPLQKVQYTSGPLLWTLCHSDPGGGGSRADNCSCKSIRWRSKRQRDNKPTYCVKQRCRALGGRCKFAA
mmetsp:Transcript_102383/g.285214  ORF Transcript_102383/g.285214 Transcript_102383/m.285214 type:complete len:106 (-) Transcript_102383:198-515(-)